MKTPGNSYLQLLCEIYRAFDFFNTHFCNGILDQPVITISSSGERGQMLGWHAENFWKERERDIAEINLCAEYLKRPPEEILETLLHEMAHLKNAQLGIIDINRNTQYHYRSFKVAAISLGLDVYKSNAGGGYCYTELGDRARLAIEKLNIDTSLFGIYRKVEYEEERPRLAAKKSKEYLYVRVRNNEKIVHAIHTLTEKSGSKIRAVENAIIAAAHNTDFDKVI